MGSETNDGWSIKVQMKDKKIIVNVPQQFAILCVFGTQDCPLTTLMTAIGTRAVMDPKNIVILYAGMTLSIKDSGNKKLSELTLEDGSLVVMALRLPGGVWPLDELEIKKRTLEPLPGYITITTKPSEPDMISLDDSDDKRAKMPCGHVIGPESMTSYCRSLLNAGKYTFACPYVKEAVARPSMAVPATSDEKCGKEWPFFLVRHVACLSPEELETFEERTSENALKKLSSFQRCPGCSNWCCQADPKNKCVRCVECTRTNHTSYDFCWDCLSKWKGDGFGRRSCGNANCDGTEKKLAILAKCETKQIEGITCPSIRACPKCGMLIEHKMHCKHMTCECKYSFCFFCLNPKGASDWQCQAYTGDCSPAPRQKSLPLTD